MPHLKKPEEPGKEHWRGKQYAFFRHEACEFFPCHPTDDPEDFNCLFCYCPLYALGEGCGGRFTYAYGGEKLQPVPAAPQTGKLWLYHREIQRDQRNRQKERRIKQHPPTGNRRRVLFLPEEGRTKENTEKRKRHFDLGYVLIVM